MRIPEDVLKCVCFLSVKETGEYGEYDHFVGTAFFVIIKDSFFIYSRRLVATLYLPNEDEPLLFFDAYLAEIRSISGLSGSPVFIMFPPGRLRADPLIPEHDQPDYRNQWFVLLLGLIRGHWSAYGEEGADDSAKDETEPFNSGITVVTPIEEAVKVIFGEQLMKERQERIAEVQDRTRRY